VSQPILQAGENQVVWDKNEVYQAGLQYLQWMHEVRHRGTFSKVALAFASLVDAVKTAPSLRGLADIWLEVSLKLKRASLADQPARAKSYHRRYNLDHPAIGGAPLLPLVDRGGRRDPAR
jgi:hypothetical protein